MRLLVLSALLFSSPALALEIAPIADDRLIEIEQTSGMMLSSSPASPFQDWDECVLMPGAGGSCQESRIGIGELSGRGSSMSDGGGDTIGTTRFDVVFRVDSDSLSFVDSLFEAETLALDGIFDASLWLVGFEELGPIWEISPGAPSSSFSQSSLVLVGGHYRLVVESTHFTAPVGQFNEWAFTFSLIPEPSGGLLVGLGLLALAIWRRSA